MARGLKNTAWGRRVTSLVAPRARTRNPYVVDPDGTVRYQEPKTRRRPIEVEDDRRVARRLVDVYSDEYSDEAWDALLARASARDLGGFEVSESIEEALTRGDFRDLPDYDREMFRLLLQEELRKQIIREFIEEERKAAKSTSSGKKKRPGKWKLKLAFEDSDGEMQTRTEAFTKSGTARLAKTLGDLDIDSEVDIKISQGGDTLATIEGIDSLKKVSSRLKALGRRLDGKKGEALYEARVKAAKYYRGKS